MGERFTSRALVAFVLFVLCIPGLSQPSTETILVQITIQARPYVVYFDRNGALVGPEFYPALKEIAGVLHDWPKWKLLVRGYTDARGVEAYNRNLSLARSEAVKRVLVTHYHLAEDRLITQGGARSAKMGNLSREQRRVEFVVQRNAIHLPRGTPSSSHRLVTPDGITHISDLN